MGAKPISDRKRKQIVADYIALQNYREVARKHKVHHATVKRIVDSGDSAEIVQKATQKQEENTQSVLEYMDSQTARKKSLLDKLLVAMEDKADNPDMFTSIKDLATAYGILTDKEIRLLELKQARENAGAAIEIVLRRKK